MKDQSLKRRKRQDLYSLYLKGLEEGRFLSMRDAAEWLCRQPAPRYYIDPKKASDYVGMILGRRSLVHLNSSQRRMARKLCQEYLDWRKQYPDVKRSRLLVLDEIVDRPAPEFYMTADAVRKMLREEINEVKSKMGWGE